MASLCLRDSEVRSADSQTLLVGLSNHRLLKVTFSIPHIWHFIYIYFHLAVSESENIQKAYEYEHHYVEKTEGFMAQQIMETTIGKIAKCPQSIQTNRLQTPWGSVQKCINCVEVISWKMVLKVVQNILYGRHFLAR